jgi:hypothetical protein
MCFQTLERQIFNLAIVMDERNYYQENDCDKVSGLSDLRR